MKKILFFVVVVVFGVSVNFAFAAVLKPYGGRILLAPTPLIECPTDYFDDAPPSDPYVIIPAGLSKPIFTGFLSPYPQFGQIVKGAWILGLHLPVPIPDCVTTTTPPVAVPIFKSVLWGTSIPGNI